MAAVVAGLCGLTFGLNNQRVSGTAQVRHSVFDIIFHPTSHLVVNLIGAIRWRPDDPLPLTMHLIIRLECSAVLIHVGVTSALIGFQSGLRYSADKRLATGDLFNDRG